MHRRSITALVAVVTLSIMGAVSLAQEQQEGIPSRGYAAFDASGHLVPFQFQRQAVSDNDILIDILYAGICHSDIHNAKSEFGPTIYPLVPGHEIVGRVAQVGKNVTKFKIGDIAGVGCMINSCGECDYCLMDKEQYCLQGTTYTYGNGNHGGYSDNIVVTEKFALQIPQSIPLEQAAPMLCAGVTTYSPLKEVGIKQGMRVGVAGLGGLGHMALQYAVSFGAEVTVFEITDAKRDTALALGAADYINTKANPGALTNLQGKYDVILATIPVHWEVQPYLDALRPMGTLISLGMPANGENTSTINLTALAWRGKRMVGSLIGGIAETQEMLDYSAAHNISAKVVVIPIQQVNEAYQRILDGEVEFRYVIDTASIEK